MLRIAPLAYWINERHAIYLRKQHLAALPVPEWANPRRTQGVLHEYRADYLTHDPILREYRFCNVFRELDRVTIWIDENIRRPFADHLDLWLMLAIARTINWPPTLQHLMQTPGAWPSHEAFAPEKLGEALDAYQNLGHKVYTGAYMIRAESDPRKHWYSWSKQRYIAEVVIGRLWEDRDDWRRFLDTPQTLQSVWERFQNDFYVGWGPFMAYEVVTDMRHTRYLGQAPDIMTWANAGPGALRGLNRLLGVDPSQRMSPSHAVALMQDILERLNSQRATYHSPFDLAMRELGGEPSDVLGLHVPKLEMRDVEHSLCEVDKYLRVRNGEGRPRAKYVPGRGY